MNYLESQNYTSPYKASLLHYLDEYVTVIESPSDVIQAFSAVRKGRRHLWLSMRVLFNFLEVSGFDENVLNTLRKALPKGANSTYPDLKVLDEKAVQKSLRLLVNAPMKYRVLFNVLLDSGLRIVEAVQLIEGFGASDVKRVGEFS